MITIENEKRVDWNAIKAEYIGGGWSYRTLAEARGIPFNTLRYQAQKDGWAKLREDAQRKTGIISAQKTAELAADNATIAAGIKRKGLLLLDRLFDDYAQHTATEHRESADGITDIKRLRDLTAAYKDLTEDMPRGDAADVEDLSPLVELLGGPGQ